MLVKVVVTVLVIGGTFLLEVLVAGHTFARALCEEDKSKLQSEYPTVHLICTEVIQPYIHILEQRKNK